MRHGLIEKKVAGERSSPSGGGAGDGGGEKLDSDWLRAAWRMQWAREAWGNEREPMWWLCDGQGAAGWSVARGSLERLQRQWPSSREEGKREERAVPMSSCRHWRRRARERGRLWHERRSMAGQRR
jgi:hypothetical protein